MNIEKRFVVNVAQQRNLRNWLPAERPSKTFAVVAEADAGTTWSPEHVQHCVALLMQRHEALRSRLAVATGDHELVQQEVLHIDDALGSLPHTHVMVEDSRLERDTVLVPVSVDPERVALDVRTWGIGDGVCLVALWVSHVFVDGYGQQILQGDLRRLLASAVLEDVAAQASDFNADTLRTVVAENQEYWTSILLAAPRSCSYSSRERVEVEAVACAQVELGEGFTRQLSTALANLRVSPYIMWVAAMSVLVSRYTGTYQQVFRTTDSNRLDERDLSVVTQLATAAFLPVQGRGCDTLGDRIEAVFAAVMDGMGRGMYDVNELLDTLNSEAHRRGAIFQPAFEVNFVGVGETPRHTEPSSLPTIREWDEPFRIDPSAAKSDLALSVAQGSCTASVRLMVRRPISAYRPGRDVLTHLMSIMQLMCTAPSMPVADVDVPQLPGAKFWHGHHSGVNVNVDAVAKMLSELPHVISCKLETRRRELIGCLEVAPSHAHEPYRFWATDRQSWLSGVIVPDEIIVVEYDG